MSQTLDTPPPARRAFLLVLDSVGIGAAGDAGRWGAGDAASDTLGHVAAACARGDCDGRGGGDGAAAANGPLRLPNLDRLGLGAAAAASTGTAPAGLTVAEAPEGLWGLAAEVSLGKDTPSGHWEITGVPVPFDWHYFPETVPTFPPDLTAALVAEAGLPGILGDCHASGTEIIARLGAEHVRTGKPICYTSADSVFQIAAHEAHFGLERLYEVCAIARRLVDPLGIGRVIARPFVGDAATGFTRTANRRDYAVPPPEPTLLDRAKADGRTVVAIGKIGDIFAHQGMTETVKAAGNDALFDATLSAVARAPAGALVMTNFVDFDTLYGHRRDPAGYAAALEHFDRRLPELAAALGPGDLVVLTADHGCDPTAAGSDHTREHVPILAFGPGIAGGTVGRRTTFADIGESIAAWLGLAPGRHGTSFL